MLKFLDQWHGLAGGLDYGHAQTKCDQLGDDPPARLQLPGPKESAAFFGKKYDFPRCSTLWPYPQPTSTSALSTTIIPGLNELISK